MRPPLTPSQSAQAGKSAYQKEDYAAAAQHFLAAQAGYAADDPLMACEMANNASVAFLADEDAAQALAVLEGVEAIFEQAGDVKRRGMTLGNRGAALEALGRTQEAETVYFQSAQLLEQAGEDQLRANVMHSLSVLQLNNGRQLQALVSMQQGLEGIKRPTPKQSFLKKLLNIPMDMIAKKKP